MPVALGPGAASTPIQEEWTPAQFARLFALTPEGAAEYLKGRDRITPTLDWRALWQEEHAQQFTVSRLTRLDLLKTVQEKIAASVGGDLTRRDWTRDVTAMLKEAGWWGNIEVMDPDTGEVLTTRFNPSRVKLIYDTNVRMAHAAGRWERIQAAKGTHPYLRYITKDDGRVREEHAAWHNLTLPVDAAFWATHYPPNGWRCRCRVIAMSQAEYDRGQSPTGDPLETTAPEPTTVGWLNKYTGEIEQVPLGIDPGFNYNVGMGRAARLAQTVDAKRAAAHPALAQAADAEGFEAPDAATLLAAVDMDGAVREGLASDKFAAFFEARPGTADRFPVAWLSDEEMALFGVSDPTLWLSRVTLDEHRARHPEVGIEDYRRIPDMVRQGQVWMGPSARRHVLLWVGGRPYRAALKADQDGWEAWFLSLVISGKQKPPKGAVRVR